MITPHSSNLRRYLQLLARCLKMGTPYAPFKLCRGFRWCWAAAREGGAGSRDAWHGSQANRPPGRGLQKADGRSGHWGPQPVVTCSVLVLPGPLPTELGSFTRAGKGTRLQTGWVPGFKKGPLAQGPAVGRGQEELVGGEGEPMKGGSGQPEPGTAGKGSLQQKMARSLYR